MPPKERRFATADPKSIHAPRAPSPEKCVHSCCLITLLLLVPADAESVYRWAIAKRPSLVTDSADDAVEAFREGAGSGVDNGAQGAGAGDVVEEDEPLAFGKVFAVLDATGPACYRGKLHMQAIGGGFARCGCGRHCWRQRD